MALLTEGLAEKALIDGRLFTVVFSTPSLAAAGTYLVGITIGDRPAIFMDRTYIATLSSGLVELFESSYTGGTPITPRNRNLEMTGAAPATYAAAPTATPSGAVLASVVLLAADSTGNANAGLLSEAERYILKANTQYVLRFTNTSSQAGIITSRFTYRKLEIIH